MNDAFDPLEDSQSPLKPDPLAASVSPAPGWNVDSHPRVMVETAFLASTSALLWILNFYFPIGPIFRMLFALPTAIAYLRWGRRCAWMTAIVASLLLGVLMGPPRSIQFMVPYGLLGVLLGGLWRAKVGWSISMGWGVLLTTFGLFFQTALVSLLVGTNLWLYLNQQVRNLLSWVFEKLGILMDPSLQAVQLVAVGLIAFQATLYLLLVHLVALLLMERLGHAIPAPPAWLQAIIDEG
ncbi:MAG TPA: DUF2232 domain-containing protein [Stenomitos sp.]